MNLIGMRCADLNLFKAKLQEVEARAVNVSGNANLTGAIVTGPLDMELAKIGGNLFLRDDAQFADVFLIDTSVGGTVETRRAKFEGCFDLSGARAIFLLLLPGSWFRKAFLAKHLRVERNIEMGGARFDDKVDLSGVEIGSMLIMRTAERGPPQWQGKSHLILHDASVKAVRLAETGTASVTEVWPPQVRLDGFTYERIGEAHDTPGAISTVIRDGGRLVEWLKLDPRYSPQPYQQLARVLTEQGDTRGADKVLFAGRDRQREDATGFRWVLDSLLRVTIGYGIGYRYFFSLAWVAVLMLIGRFVFGPTVRLHWPEPGMSLLFSLDQLLPVVGILPGADDIAKTLSGWPHAYLALHRILGFLLGSFVVAGLSGMTKK